MTDHKFRPSQKCLYVLGELTGNLRGFEVLINRILPLRTSVGQEDQLVCLGNYLGADTGGAQIIDALLNIQQAYAEKVVCLRGSQEELFLRAILGDEKDYRYWMSDYHGGSTIASYLQKAELTSNPQTFPHGRLKDLVPASHLDFLKGLPFYWELDGILFFHGAGIDLNKSARDNSLSSFLFGDSGARQLHQRITQGKEVVEKIFEGNTDLISAKGVRKRPEVYGGYGGRWTMLSGKPGEVLGMDVWSRQVVRVKRGKQRPYPVALEVLESLG